MIFKSSIALRKSRRDIPSGTTQGCFCSFIHFVFIHIVIRKYRPSMNTWHNIFSCHQIFCPMCQKIFMKYFTNVVKYS